MLCIESEFDLCVLVAYIYIVFQGAYSLTLIIIFYSHFKLASVRCFRILPFFALFSSSSSSCAISSAPPTLTLILPLMRQKSLPHNLSAELEDVLSIDRFMVKVFFMILIAIYLVHDFLHFGLHLVFH